MNSRVCLQINVLYFKLSRSIQIIKTVCSLKRMKKFTCGMSSERMAIENISARENSIKTKEPQNQKSNSQLPVIQIE